MSSMPRWWWPPVVLLAMLDSVEALENKLALVLGCSIGGLVFFLLIVILFILVCKRPDEKTRHGSNSLHSHSGAPSPGAPVQVPPGVWTSNPTMYALRQAQMGRHQPPNMAPHQAHYGNGYVNRKAPPPPRPKRAPAPPRPHRPRQTRDKTVKEKTIKLEEDMRFPQEMRTSVDKQGVRADGTAAARIYRSEPSLGNGVPPQGHVAKIYSGYKIDEERGDTNKDVAHVFRSSADMSRTMPEAEGQRRSRYSDVEFSSVYAIPLDAITQSDWVLNGGYHDASHTLPGSQNQQIGSRNPYAHGVLMRPSDASQFDHKRRSGESPRHSGSHTPVPSQILMYQHLQHERLAKSRAPSERLPQKEAASRQVSRSQSDAAHIRHFSPENDPSAIYSRPMKLKRHSVDSKGSTPARITEESNRLSDPMSPPPPPLPPQGALSPIDEGANQMTVRAVIENHSPNHVSDHVPPPTGVFRIPSPDRGSPTRTQSPARTQSPDQLSAILPSDRPTARRKSVDEQTTVSEKHHQGEVMDAFRFLEDFEDHKD